MPADQGIERCREVFDRAQGDKKAMASAQFSQALLEAGLGRFEEAEELFSRARALLEEVALPVWIAGPLTQCLGWALLLQGDPAGAERELRAGHATLSAIGEVTLLSSVAGMLAEAIYAQGRDDEAQTLTSVSEELAGAEDVITHVLWRSVRAKVLARKGRIEDALLLARESATLVEATDSLLLRWHTMMSQAEVFAAAGRTADAQTALSAAIDAAERKQNLVGARLAREALDALYATRPQPRTT